MPEIKPGAAELLKAAQDYLEGELLPTLGGQHWFQTKVAIKLLAIVRRELELGPALNEGERERLAGLLGRAGTLRDLSRELADKIRAGAIALDDPALRDHLRQSIADALRINNPKWLEEQKPW